MKCSCSRLAEHHIRAHRDRPGRLLVVMAASSIPSRSSDPLARAMAADSQTAWVLIAKQCPQACPPDLGRQPEYLADAVLSAGGFDAARGAAAVEALGWYRHNQDTRHAVPDARARVSGTGNIEAWSLRSNRSNPTGCTSRTPARALDASGHQDLTVESLEQLLTEHSANVGLVRTALEGFSAGPQMWRLKTSVRRHDFTAELERRAKALLTHLRRIAEARGRLSGLKALGKSSYAEILRAQTLPPPGARGTRYLLAPNASDGTGWLSVLPRFLWDSA